MPILSRPSCSKGLQTRGANCAARLFGLAVATWCAAALAAPWRPTDDALVLAEVQARGVNPALESAERDYRARPDDVAIVESLVREQLATGRRLSDPRYFGQAEAVLARARSLPQRPPALDIAWADILQHRHDYEASRRVLDGVLSAVPREAQARLMRAQMNLAQGRFADARRDCTALLTVGAVGRVCLAQAMAMTGDLDRGYALALRDATAGGNAATRSWILTALADMAARRGDPDSQQWLEKALLADPDDQYARLALADALIDRGELSAAARTAGAGPRSDAALLRLAIVAGASGGGDAPARELEARYREATARGELIHLRDLARFRLEVLHDAQGALEAARRNFASQKERWDARLLLEAALAVRDRGAVAEYRTWQRATGYQDRRLATLTAAAAEAG